MTEPDEAQKWLEDQADRDWLEDDDYEPSARPETVSELDDNARTFAELGIKCGGTVALLERAREEAIDVAEHAYKIGYRAGQAASAERIKALEGLLRECADDLEGEIQARSANDLPRRIERDMEPVKKARALLKEADQ
jgi:hypothetical protein